MLNAKQELLDKQEDSGGVLSKPMFSVHISNDISLFARKIMNSLIKNVHNAENSDTSIFTDKYGVKYYEITFQTIEENLSLDKYHQKKDIIKGLEELMKTLIQFNVFGRDKKFKGAMKPTFQDVAMTTLLSNIRYREFFNQEEEQKDSENNKIYYSFTTMMLEAIISPIPYGKISFEEQNQLQSKYSLALWEMLKTEIDISKTTTCKTQIMTIDTYQALIAGSGSGYTEFKRINEKLIKKPLHEVNNKTNVQAKVILHKEGRKTTGVQFEATSKNDLKLTQHENALHDNKKDRKEVINKLRKYTQNEKVINDILTQYQDDSYINANIDAVSSNPRVNIALVRAAIRDDYVCFKSGRDLFGVDDSTSLPATELQTTIATNNKLNYKLIKILLDIGVSEKKIKQFGENQYSEQRILENIENAKCFARKSKTEVTAPLIIQAIEDNYAGTGAEKDKMIEMKKYILQLKTLIFCHEGVKKKHLPAKYNYIGQNIFFYKLFQRQEFAQEYQFKLEKEGTQGTLEDHIVACKEYLANQFREIDVLIKLLEENFHYNFNDFLQENYLTEKEIYQKMEITKGEFLEIKASLL
jgi:plasmid replication initiation protein